MNALLEHAMLAFRTMFEQQGARNGAWMMTPDKVLLGTNWEPSRGKDGLQGYVCSAFRQGYDEVVVAVGVPVPADVSNLKRRSEAVYLIRVTALSGETHQLVALERPGKQLSPWVDTATGQEV